MPKSAEKTRRVHYRILGPLEVLRDGKRIELNSPKQRTLLLDLLVNRGRSVSRDRLIDDLWAENPPATAPGVLQNYASALRRVLGADAIDTVGTGYAIAVAAEQVDADRFEALVELTRSARSAGDAEGMGRHSTAALALWRGQPLADVAYEPFARAAIARLEALHGEAIELQAESQIAAGRPREAIPGLEEAVGDHPLREELWRLLMIALHQSGQQADALRAFQRARRVVIEQLGLEPSARLKELERAILAQDEAPDHASRPALVRRSHWIAGSSRAAPVPPALAGRRAERAALLAHLRRGWASQATGVCVLQGEPGIGKTRLLEEANLAAIEAGSTVLSGRGYEAETGRPFGAWIDALRSVGPDDLPEAVRRELTPLLPELGDERPAVEDPARLHDGVTTAVATMAAKTPVTVLVDDLHWLDEASASLLHYLVRHLPGRPVALVATTRVAELDANPFAGRLVEALRRDDLLRTIAVGPLSADTIAELTGPIAPGADAAMIAEASNGNPLFAIEMARGLARGDDALSSRLDALIGDRLGRLSTEASTLVPWLAAFGRGVHPSTLAEIVNRPLEELVEPLGEMEQHAVVQVRAGGTYDFNHDLVRTAAYRRLSTPRRSMLHARIGVVLESSPDPDDALAADAARHAEAGDDSATCARASVRAARRCLRLGAHREAEDHALRGRQHARLLAPAERVAVDLQLIHTLLHPALRLHNPGNLASDLTELCADAQRLDLGAELSSGLYLLARIHHWGWGDIPRARALMQRALDVIESAGGPDIDPILEGARCLAYLEIDMPRTTELFEQLSRLHDLATRSHQYQWGLGLVRTWNGDLDGARAALTLAIALAGAKEDHWVTFECTARLALLEIELGDPHNAAPLLDDLATSADRLGQIGSETRFAVAITALYRFVDDPAASAQLQAAIGALEAIDARFLIPELLGIAAQLAYRRGDLDQSTLFAQRAVDLAGDVDKPNEAARAHALLACVAAARHDHDSLVAHVDAVPQRGNTLPANVEHWLHEAARLGGSSNP
ncbi:MAG TPA: BTAD domain-containing putative transcriptional regulator [Acidimicrobiales bacterium]|nr:BTAD domain-containing putative transcriptional regulator [Acidimicrobiales bacterium]